MHFRIALIPGDGIGPDIVSGALGVMNRVLDRFSHTANFKELDAGGIAIDKFGIPLPSETITECKASDSILLGAVGGPKWENLGDIRPEQALLGLRGELGLYANLRPAMLFNELKEACPLKEEIVKDGLDIMIVRELTGGIYFGDRGTSTDGNSAYDTETYTRLEIARIIKRAIDIARLRNKTVTVVDKANILDTSRLWRKVAAELFANCPDLTVNYMYVDNAAMQLVRNPSQFDVMVTSNIFGDILSDEASMVTGSIGMLPSASLGDGDLGMYEPIHGSAPDIAGQNLANPLATILSVAMMFRYSFHLPEEANAIEQAVAGALADGMRTRDIYTGKDGQTLCGTTQMAQEVEKRI